MNRKVIIVLTILFSSIGFTLDFQAKNSKPDWIDYTTRKLKYPDRLYLTGFVSENSSKDREAKTIEQLKDLAKVNLLQSIKVDLKLESALELQNITKGGQTRSSERFIQNSYAAAQATIVGIQIETFYDSKAKINYAFAYAKIATVINYYKKILSNNLADIDPYFESFQMAKAKKDHIKAIQDLDHIRENINKIKVAQSILTALKVSELSLEKTLTETHALKLNQEINQLFKDKTLSINQACYFLVYGLYLQQPSAKHTIFLNKFTFSNTHLTSSLSQHLVNALKNHFLKFGYIITEKTDNPFQINGHFDWQDDVLKVNMTLNNLKNQDIVAANYNYLSLNWIKENKIAYLPGEVLKARLLEKLALTHKLSSDSQVGWSRQENLSILASVDSQGVQNLPLILSLENKKDNILDQGSTDLKGIAYFNTKRKLNQFSNKAISVRVNIPKFIGLPQNHPFIKTINSPTYTFYLSTSTVKVYVETEEKNLNKNLTIPFLEPRIKQILTDKHYEFSPDKANSDLYIKIEANTRPGPNSYGIFFSYIDATISVIDLGSNHEVYKNKFTTIKGAGQNFELAGMKAFEMLSKKVKNELLKELE